MANRSISRPWKVYYLSMSSFAVFPTMTVTPSNYRQPRRLAFPVWCKPRGDQVALANALGSGFLEAPALTAFLSAACQFLLTEELRLPTQPTWWCGNSHDMQFVTDNLSRLIIRDAFFPQRLPPIVAGELSQDQQRQLLEKMPPLAATVHSSIAGRNFHRSGLEWPGHSALACWFACLCG